jgi:hypothetical protein
MSVLSQYHALFYSYGSTVQFKSGIVITSSIDLFAQDYFGYSRSFMLSNEF